MAELKTKQNEASVEKFLNSVKDEKQRADSFEVLKLMKEVTKSEPKMWGTSIVGFGKYHYVYASGQEGDWPVTGFSPRKGKMTLYIMTGFDEKSDKMKKLGKYKTGKCCLYIKKLEDIDLSVLKDLVKNSVEAMKKK